MKHSYKRKVNIKQITILFSILIAVGIIYFAVQYIKNRNINQTQQQFSTEKSTDSQRLVGYINLPNEYTSQNFGYKIFAPKGFVIQQWEDENKSPSQESLIISNHPEYRNTTTGLGNDEIAVHLYVMNKVGNENNWGYGGYAMAASYFNKLKSKSNGEDFTYRSESVIKKDSVVIDGLPAQSFSLVPADFPGEYFGNSLGAVILTESVSYFFTAGGGKEIDSEQIMDLFDQVVASFSF